MDQQLAQFEKMYDTHSDAIFRHLFMRLGDRERAKELTQEAFMKVWQYLASGKEISYEKAFLYRIAHNLFVNEIRTDKRTKSLDEMMDDTSFDVVDTHTHADDDATAHELLAYLDTLKDSYREVLVMRYIDDLPVTEIAKLLIESETNISMRIKRALDKLKETYEHNGKTRNHG